ncbi:hypothetical protein AB0C76_31485 [Kitasatospora sp. NPDC048722]|uniref:hypothetical protein n=1 Tax=Kitasatospora sp. NPDC048722 TaxID=3155639 RepID=UPI0033FC0646
MAHPTRPYPATAQPRPRPRILPGFGLRGPRRDKHVLATADLGALALPVGDDGVLIGVDVQGRPSVLGLFRPGAHDLVLVGGLWTAQLITLRAASTGARVAVETGRPQAWSALARAAGGGQPCLTVHQAGRLGPQGASVTSPVLVVRDLTARPPRSRLSAAPWQTTLTVLPWLLPEAARLVGAADLVGVQRVQPEEAGILRRALSLPPEDVAALPALGDDLTLWTTRMHRQYVRAVAGQAELQLLGAPRRVDPPA